VYRYIKSSPRKADMLKPSGQSTQLCRSAGTKTERFCADCVARREMSPDARHYPDPVSVLAVPPQHTPSLGRSSSTTARSRVPRKSRATSIPGHLRRWTRLRWYHTPCRTPKPLHRHLKVRWWFISVWISRHTRGNASTWMSEDLHLQPHAVACRGSRAPLQFLGIFAGGCRTPKPLHRHLKVRWWFISVWISRHTRGNETRLTSTPCFDLDVGRSSSTTARSRVPRKSRATSTPGRPCRTPKPLHRHLKVRRWFISVWISRHTRGNETRLQPHAVACRGSRAPLQLLGVVAGGLD
jgi:hypothetical protein